MAAASKAEIGALFHNGQEVAHIRQILHELGRPQQLPTRITTDNSTADGFAYGHTKIKRSKAMDMQFYWVRDRVKQGQLRIHWQKGELNLAEYYTKHHPPAHHIKMRPTYLHTGTTNNVAIANTPDCRGVLIRVPDPEPVYCEPATLAVSDSWLSDALGKDWHQYLLAS